MNKTMFVAAAADQASRMEHYYRLHSKIYDATRWSFLFGRKTIIHQVAAISQPANILEVGCGTGKNLLTLARTFPQANLAGLDISVSMLKMAQKNLDSLAGRVNLWHTAYDRPLHTKPAYDLILFSYSLSMINPDWQRVIQYAQADLVEDGLMAVVDFHNSAWPFFKRWMAVNHVRMDGHLLPELAATFQPQRFEIPQAYGGVWEYFLFIGKNKDPKGF